MSINAITKMLDTSSVFVVCEVEECVLMDLELPHFLRIPCQDKSINVPARQTMFVFA